MPLGNPSPISLASRSLTGAWRHITGMKRRLRRPIGCLFKTPGGARPCDVGRREESPYFVDSGQLSFEFLLFAQPWSGSELRFASRFTFYCLFGSASTGIWMPVYHSFRNCYCSLDPIDWTNSLRELGFLKIHRSCVLTPSSLLLLSPSHDQLSQEAA